MQHLCVYVEEHRCCCCHGNAYSIRTNVQSNILYICVRLAFNNIILFIFVFIASKVVQNEMPFRSSLCAHHCTKRNINIATIKCSNRVSIVFKQFCPSKCGNTQFTHVKCTEAIIAQAKLFANRKWEIHKYFIASLLSYGEYTNARAVHTSSQFEYEPRVSALVQLLGRSLM